MNLIRFFIVLCLVVLMENSFAQLLTATAKEKLIEDRIEYLRNAKLFISNAYWKEFGKNEFEGTIVYYADSASYFINPKEEMKQKVSKYTILENDYNWNIWKMRLPNDSTDYVLLTTFQYDPKAKWDINYKTPVLFCSSPELLTKVNKEMSSTEDWVIDVMHELYHQYQYSNDALLTYVMRLYQEKKMIDMDSLQSVYLQNKMVNDTLKMENDLLKKAIAAGNIEDEKKYFAAFLKLRGARNLAYFKKNKFWLSTPEDFWEKMEGACLMMEEKLRKDFNKIPVPDGIQKNDLLYKNGSEYVAYKPDAAKDFGELDDQFYYVGTTGYNMIKLLEKNKVNYKENYLQYASKSLSLMLKYFYKI